MYTININITRNVDLGSHIISQMIGSVGSCAMSRHVTYQGHCHGILYFCTKHCAWTSLTCLVMMTIFFVHVFILLHSDPLKLGSLEGLLSVPSSCGK